MVVNFYSDPKLIPDRNPNYAFTVVLDVDDTLVHRNRDDGVIRIRPNAKEFIDRIRSFSDVELIIWSAGKEVHIRDCLKVLSVDDVIAIVRCDVQHWDVKDMKLIARQNRNYESIMIVDDREDTITSMIHFCVNGWPHNIVHKPEDDIELEDVLSNMMSHFMITRTQSRADTDLGPFGIRNVKSWGSIYG